MQCLQRVTRPSFIAAVLCALVGVWIAVGTLSVPASAQTPAAEAGQGVQRPATSNNPIRDRFRDGMTEFQGQLDKLASDVEAITKRLEKQSEATVEQRRSEVDLLRQKLTSLGAQIQPDAPLAQRVDRMEQWLSAQRTRVGNKRSNLGVEFVERLLRDYKEMELEIAASREQLNTGAKGIDGLLTELSQAEDRIAELLLAEDAHAAVDELREVVGNISKTIESIRNRVRGQFATPGA